MKAIFQKLIFVFSLTLLSNTASAQSQFSDFLAEKPISIGYFGHYYFHPGLKIGTQFDWRSWEKVKERKKRTRTKSRSLFISPQIGFYVHPGNHSGLLLNTDFGYQRLSGRWNFYTAYSIGLGYLAHFNAGTTYYTDNNGEIKTKQLASRSYFMPALNFELGQQFSNQIGWYSKFTMGTRLFYNTGISPETFIELGVKFKFGK